MTFLQRGTLIFFFSMFNRYSYGVEDSYVERQNLTLRMNNRRFTRLTNAFSKKLENHKWSCALHFFHYNFARSACDASYARGR